mmetsp:Transcript_23451/g.61194  ORF Transcript_23451/g.61194 Transcript_23451/m.61194 type:complete len:204 (-) Transcript_23451:495-1106(-)
MAYTTLGAAERTENSAPAGGPECAPRTSVAPFIQSGTCVSRWPSSLQADTPSSRAAKSRASTRGPPGTSALTSRAATGGAASGTTTTHRVASAPRVGGRQSPQPAPQGRLYMAKVAVSCQRGAPGSGRQPLAGMLSSRPPLPAFSSSAYTRARVLGHTASAVPSGKALGPWNSVPPRRHPGTPVSLCSRSCQAVTPSSTGTAR